MHGGGQGSDPLRSTSYLQRDRVLRALRKTPKQASATIVQPKAVRLNDSGWDVGECPREGYWNEAANASRLR